MFRAGLQMNRDCSVLGIGSGFQTDTDHDFYCSAKTETGHPVAPRDRTEMSSQYTETRPSSIFLILGSFGSVRGSRGIWVCSTQIVSSSIQLAYMCATSFIESYNGPHRRTVPHHRTAPHCRTTPRTARRTASSYRIVVLHIVQHHRRTAS